MHVQVSRIEQNIVMVVLSGSLTRWGDRLIDEPFINNLLQCDVKKLVFDLTELEQVDSSGVQLIFECFSAVRKAGCEIRFAGANPRVSRLFRVTGLDAVLPFCPTVAVA